MDESNIEGLKSVMDTNEERNTLRRAKLREWSACGDEPSGSERHAFEDGFDAGWQARASQELRPNADFCKHGVACQLCRDESKDLRPQGNDLCDLCPCCTVPKSLHPTRPGSGELRERINSELRHLQRQFESLGTIGDEILERLARPAFERVAAFAASERGQPAPSAGSGRCPSCGSANRKYRNWRWTGTHTVECDDPWHSAPESGKEGAVERAQFQVDHSPYETDVPALTPAPAQGAEVDEPMSKYVGDLKVQLAQKDAEIERLRRALSEYEKLHGPLTIGETEVGREP